MTDNKQATLALGTKPVGQLLWQYALPAIVAMSASSLYNIIDRAMIGQIVGPEAIAGLGITFPFMNLSAAFGAAVGVGSSASISVKLGQKDYATAQNLLGNTMTLNLIIGFSFMVICMLFLDPILYFFGASEVTLPYAREFMTVILLGNVMTHMYFGMNAVLRAAGKPKHAMYSVLFTVAMNIVLVLTFVWWFRWGIRGAALATVTSQTIAMCWQLWLFSNKNEILHLKRGIYRLKKRLVSNIIAIGISPFLMNVTSCVIVIFMNNQFVRYGGDMAVGAYSIANSVVMVFFMFVMGVCQGMQPIVGYNYGAEKYDRMLRCLFLAIGCATSDTAGGMDAVDAVLAPDSSHIYYRRDADRTVGTRHKTRHAGVLCSRIAGHYHPLLPEYRKGEGVDIPVAVAPAVPAVADGVCVPTAVGSGRCVVLDASQRLPVVCDDDTHADVVYEEI